MVKREVSMRKREKAREKKIKVTITLDRKIKMQIEEFVKGAENPKINLSSFFEDLADYALNDKPQILNGLFPLDKRFENKK